MFSLPPSLLSTIFDTPQCSDYSDDPPGHTTTSKHSSLFDIWSSSRVIAAEHGDLLLTPGGQRPMTTRNISLAIHVSERCIPHIFSLLWSLHPLRVMLMLSLDIFRGLLPACRGYSQAMIINELQAVISSGGFSFARLCRLIATDVLRMAVESLIDSLANRNADIVQSSARFIMEYRQMEQRLRMDVPTLENPHIRDLFQESELFVRSFSGMSSFGLLSPLDLFRVLALISELASHAVMLWSLTSSGTHVWLLLFSVISTIFPLLLSPWTRNRDLGEDTHDVKEAHATAKQNRMRGLAHSDIHRPEIVLFGLGPWILQSWAKARRLTLGLEQNRLGEDEWPYGSLFSQLNLTGAIDALQNIPILIALQASSNSLGSFSLYRSSVQSFFFTGRQLAQTLRMGFQGIFLMGAFCTAMEVQPQLQPESPTATIKYRNTTRKGMKIELRNVSYTYPGNHTPALKDVSLVLEAGETLAIVGYNGSGKSTLAKILLRLVDYHAGRILINDLDLCHHDPTDFHTHVTAVLQGFSKFDSSFKENVGVGYVPEAGSDDAVEKAVELAGAEHILYSLPNGVETMLDSGVAGQSSSSSSAPSSPNLRGEFGPIQGCLRHQRYGLSGGEWQRIAISRAFMRANRPEVDLIVLDEPTSSLDPHAQNHVFDTVEEISRSPTTGKRIKTVVFITHRLSTARRADKIAMMEHGAMTEFGTHQELLAKGGSYASLYQASV
ncbi:P-loop containing nucleoside triphosphate hydrolase protein [Irpex rosettiformis]|uniref:P-loop containing nucleoside triphosphate hydrolase protein n=1 Tax=Irpex rosettiformis TaxID=378272 RepID=A0ACB8UE66_9APHY|nr:P-loop containing nucleoside triphosphate hydrolase protein [Irpex rosettiformis]